MTLRANQVPGASTQFDCAVVDVNVTRVYDGGYYNRKKDTRMKEV